MIDVGSFYDNRAAETVEAQRAAKASPPKKLAPGARSDVEHQILTALRKQPASSMADLQRSARVNNETALDFAWRALLDRGLVREERTFLNTTRLVAVE